MTRPTGTKAEFEARRRRAVDLLELGRGVREIAEVVGVHPGSVSRWNAAYEEEGEEELAAAPRTNGRTLKLAEEHYPALEELLLKGPKAHGFETKLWTLNRIAAVIDWEFDVSVSSFSVWRYLREVGNRHFRSRHTPSVCRWSDGRR